MRRKQIREEKEENKRMGGRKEDKKREGHTESDTLPPYSQCRLDVIVGR